MKNPSTRLEILADRRLAVCFLLGLTMSLMSTAGARPTLGPPSIQLRTNLSNVVVARLVEITPDHKLRFQKVRDLHNEAPESIVMPSDAQRSRTLVENQTYIVAYIGWESTRHPRSVYPRPGGPVLVNLAGAQPSLFRESPRIERMIAWDLVDSLQSPAGMLPIILEGMTSDDRQERDFFVTELITRETLHKALSEADVQRLLGVLENPDTPSKTRKFLLDHSRFFTERIGEERIRTALVQLVSSFPLDLDLESADPGLIRTALLRLRNYGRSDDASIASRWVASNHTGVVDAALGAMEHLKPGSSRQPATRALAQTFVDRAVRLTLTQHLQRRDAAIRSID